VEDEADDQQAAGEVGEMVSVMRLDDGTLRREEENDDEQ
jgi:hypothetical protein